MTTICESLGCDTVAKVRGLCNRCYERLRSAGRFRGVSVDKPTPEERFFVKVNAHGVCWEWTAFRNPEGYGMFGGGGDGGRTHLAHRWSYAYLVGEIPEGLTLDHLCRNRACVNPDHLEPVTHAENCRRGGLRKYCKRGHVFADDFYVDGNGKRHCRPCAKARDRERYQQKKQKKAS